MSTNSCFNPIAAALLLGLLAMPAIQAKDFLYVEDTVEYAKLVSVESDTAVRQGTIYLEHDCPSCPTQLVFSAQTLLDTPFGKNRPLQELAQWQGNPVMVHYSLPRPVATQIVIYQLNQFAADDADVDEAQE